MRERIPLAASSFWFLIAALSILLGVLTLLGVAGRTAYFFAHPVLLRVAYLLLACLFGLLAASGSVLGFLSDSAAGRRIGIVAALAFLVATGALVCLWIVRIP